MKSMKHIIEKSCKGGNIGIDAFREAIIEFRNTPRQHGLSPAQLVFGRPMRSHAVTHYRLFKKEWQRKIEDVDMEAARLRAKSKAYYDERTKPLAALDVGTVVRVQHPVSHRWDEIAEVIEKKHSGRSYVVRTESGRVFLRNRRFLRLFYSPS